MSSVNQQQSELSIKLQPLLSEGGRASIENLMRLSGGASQETWALDIVENGKSIPLILRRTPNGQEQTNVGIPLDLEASLIERAGKADVKVPDIRYVLKPKDNLGPGFVMQRIDGEALPQNFFVTRNLRKHCLN